MAAQRERAAAFARCQGVRPDAVLQSTERDAGFGALTANDAGRLTRNRVIGGLVDSRLVDLSSNVTVGCCFASCVAPTASRVRVGVAPSIEAGTAIALKSASDRTNGRVVMLDATSGRRDKLRARPRLSRRLEGPGSTEASHLRTSLWGRRRAPGRSSPGGLQSLLCPRGVDLSRIAFDHPATLRVHPDGGHDRGANGQSALPAGG